MNALTPIEYSPRPTPVVAALTRIQSAAARVDHAESTANLMQQARAMRTMWQAALREILREYGEDEAGAKSYLRSRDGRMVLTLCGYDPDIDLSRFSLQPIAERTEAHRMANEPARAARKAAKAAGGYIDNVGRFRSHEVKLPQPGTAGDKVLRAAEKLYKDDQTVNTAAVQRLLPEVPANTIACCLSTWRKYRSSIGWDA